MATIRQLAFIIIACSIVFLSFDELRRALVLDIPHNTLGANVPAGSTFQLASQQSFGFFDDIGEDLWRQSQRIHARLFPNYYKPGNLTQYSNGINDKGKVPALRNSAHWNGQNFQEEFHCPAAQRIPADSALDGPKWVCDPHRISRQPSCLVYSIGSNGNVMFEKGIKEEIGEFCEIHTFDPVTTNIRNGDFATALKGYATFHPWGLGTEEEAKQKQSKFKTLQQTMRELGHLNRTIDIFKIDCEWCEFFTYKDWLDPSIDLRQILVETHNAPMPNVRDFFFSLHDAGYVIFSKEANYPNGAGGVEFAFLKLHTSFFINGTTYSQYMSS
jgi:hypothetical protein